MRSWVAKSIDARIIIGSLIIKHIGGKDDRGAIEMIAENPYMHYFLGLDHFSSKPVFGPSLLFISVSGWAVLILMKLIKLSYPRH